MTTQRKRKLRVSKPRNHVARAMHLSRRAAKHKTSQRKEKRDARRLHL